MQKKGTGNIGKKLSTYTARSSPLVETLNAEIGSQVILSLHSMSPLVGTLNAEIGSQVIRMEPILFHERGSQETTHPCPPVK